MAGIVQCIEAAAIRNKVLDRQSLFFRHPGNRLSTREIACILEVLFVTRIEIRPGIAVHRVVAVAKDQKKLVGPERCGRKTGNIDRVVDRGVKCVEYSIQTDPDIIGIVGAVANQRHRAHWGFGGCAQGNGT